MAPVPGDDRAGVPLKVQDHLEMWARAVRAQRRQQRLSREAFARILQVSRSTVQRMEGADPKVAVAVWLNALMSLNLAAVTLPVLDPIYQQPPTARRRRSPAGQTGQNLGQGDDDF